MHAGDFCEADSESSKKEPEGRRRPEPWESNGSGAGLQAETSGGSVNPADDVADTEDRTMGDVTRGKSIGMSREGGF